MKVPNPFDEGALAGLLDQQRRLAWDLDTSIHWKRGIYLDKPLVPLDDKNLFFPRSSLSQEQRLVLSQFMGLMIASTISEMEIAMGRLRVLCWEPLMKRCSVNPELIALGEEFFEEEAKHSRAFGRYVDLFADEVNVSPDELRRLLPQVNRGLVDRIFIKNSSGDGMAVWWLLATVEEESILIYRHIMPHRTVLDPLYVEIHRRHFEEEARHASYAFLMLELGMLSPRSLWSRCLHKIDYLISEAAMTGWMFFEFSRVFDAKAFQSRHPFFKILHRLQAELDIKTLPFLLRDLSSSIPYFSSLINPGYHPDLHKELRKRRSLRLPLAAPQPSALSWGSH